MNHNVDPQGFGERPVFTEGVQCLRVGEASCMLQGHVEAEVTMWLELPITSWVLAYPTFSMSLLLTEMPSFLVIAQLSLESPLMCLSMFLSRNMSAKNMCFQLEVARGQSNRRPLHLVTQKSRLNGYKIFPKMWSMDHCWSLKVYVWSTGAGGF